MKRRTLLAASLALPAILAGRRAPAAEDKLTVLLEWFVNPDHAPLVLAEALGLFAAQGLVVELVPPADPSAPPRLVAAGQADVAVHYQPNLVLDVAAGLPLKRFGTLVASPLNTLIVLKDGPVKSLADLKGRRIGYSVSGFEDALVGQMLASVGLSASDVELVNVNFSLTPALLSGQVDATVGGFRNFELTQMAIEGREGLAFLPEEHGVPAYDELIFVAHADRTNDPRLPRFLAAVDEATRRLRADPAEGWRLFLAAHPDLDDRLNRQAFADTLPLFAQDPARLDRERYAKLSAFLEARGLVDEAPGVEALAVELGA
ncbi:ABC transporter substrate-binding protein [Antarcticirhabdus aurantiaca]|uniref:ABC transporter substrate-binding protein n=1 Tax=Antarcticirhabdus aurantiaca TaxID=2606717 RepID=A0ACD4NR60_9HYPH|nr:ABC transporter substrate-binding protein [Antarcticirhabdus aurantiaca]WAJ29363.1 ABC transporter substrate-binding protein [Jeongeuplla avenae]